MDDSSLRQLPSPSPLCTAQIRCALEGWPMEEGIQGCSCQCQLLFYFLSCPSLFHDGRLADVCHGGMSRAGFVADSHYHPALWDGWTVGLGLTGGRRREEALNQEHLPPPMPETA